MSTDHLMIGRSVNINFGNTFHQHNGPNQRQHVHKPTGQNYQCRSFQIPMNYSITYLKEYCCWCVLNNKGMRQSLIQNGGKL